MILVMLIVAITLPNSEGSGAMRIWTVQLCSHNLMESLPLMIMRTETLPTFDTFTSKFADHYLYPVIRDLFVARPDLFDFLGRSGAFLVKVDPEAPASSVQLAEPRPNAAQVSHTMRQISSEQLRQIHCLLTKNVSWVNSSVL